MNRNLLLLHGALGTKAQFKSLREELSADFDVHVLDFEGHGGKHSTNDFTMSLFTENVIGYLRSKGITKTHVFGYSMGGYVALNVAKEYSESVERIITLGTKFAWTKETAEKEIRMLNPDKIEEKVPAFAKNLASIHTENNWKDVVTKTAKMMYGLGIGEKLTDEELGQIKHNVLIGIGSQDRMVTMEESKTSASVLPNGRLEVIENFQHPIDKIDEEKLSAIIMDYINS